MITAKRPFRSTASIDAEATTRNAVVPFLRNRGFTDIREERKVAGTAVSQTVEARSPDGILMKMRIRLCWRREGRKAREKLYSASQLRARLINDDWDDTLQFIFKHDLAEGNTHTLFLQFEAAAFVFAALIPRDDLIPIWKRQRKISDDLIRSGKMGRIGKNHATNGASPTIWLQDDRTPDAHKVADALWAWPTVRDLVALPSISEGPRSEDDTFDDCPVDLAQFGSDGVVPVKRMRSGYARDRKVREKVIERAKGKCERESCKELRDFLGFLDVHHILGVGTSDRVWNCVAVCPNCHREAHFGPDRDALNLALLVYALRYKPQSAKGSK